MAWSFTTHKDQHPITRIKRFSKESSSLACRNLKMINFIRGNGIRDWVDKLSEITEGGLRDELKSVTLDMST
jgi:hypothetical protein